MLLRNLERVAATCGLLMALCCAPCIAAECKIQELAELKVTMVGTSPVVQVGINGTPVRLIADSGDFYSVLTPGSAAELKLRLGPAPDGMVMYGINGSTSINLTTVQDFSLAGVMLHRLQFIVGGSEMGGGTSGLLGQNVLHVADVEYDLANGVIRLMKPKDCGKGALAYWAGSQGFSEMDLRATDQANPFTVGTALLNGDKIHVLFDTGASTSMLSLSAAQQLGIKPDGNGVKYAGTVAGAGRTLVRTWIAPFASFKLGDEEIRNTHLRFGDMTLGEANMLIGADFFLSHRVYVSNQQHKLYFTYNGGMVFNLTTTPERGAAEARAADTASAQAPPTDASASTASPAANPSADAGPQPGDAAGFSQRGMAFAARRDYAHAFADLDRACDLAPDNPEYFYERGMAHWSNRQPGLALTDLNRALELKPDYVNALIARASLHKGQGELSTVATDLDTAANSAAREADARFTLAGEYEGLDSYQQAIAQYDDWIPAHSTDVKLAAAYNGRCWARTLLAQELKQALDDCNRAVRMYPKAGQYLDSRGLVRLRLGDYKKAVDDYTLALSDQPKLAWSLYGRGLAEQHLGKASEAQTDIAAAKAIAPGIVERAAKFGIVPAP